LPVVGGALSTAKRKTPRHSRMVVVSSEAGRVNCHESKSLMTLYSSSALT
jgi:hypothetical protein